MAYKFKPNKGVAKRMRISKTGKLKHRHEKNSHLRSRRSGKLKRHLGRAGVLAEGHSRNMRKFLGMTGRRPNQVAHEKALAEKQAEQPKEEPKEQAAKVQSAPGKIAKPKITKEKSK